jgi:hypothetical protein
VGGGQGSCSRVVVEVAVDNFWFVHEDWARATLTEPFLNAGERRTQPNRCEGGGGEGDGATNRPATADGNLLRWVRFCSFHRLVSSRGIWPSICWILDLFRLDSPFYWV